MSLRPQPLPLVPEATAVAVHAAFAKGHLYVELRAEFGRLYDDQLFADPPKLAKISWVCAILDDERRYRPPHKSMRHSAHACPFPSSMVPRPPYSPHVPKRGVKKAPGPHLYKARS